MRVTSERAVDVLTVLETRSKNTPAAYTYQHVPSTLFLYCRRVMRERDQRLKRRREVSKELIFINSIYSCLLFQQPNRTSSRHCGTKLCDIPVSCNCIFLFKMDKVAPSQF